MEASGTVPRLFGHDALLAPRANTKCENNGWPHGSVPEDLHRPVFPHSHQSIHLSRSFTGATNLWPLPSELYVRKNTQKGIELVIFYS